MAVIKTGATSPKARVEAQSKRSTEGLDAEEVDKYAIHWPEESCAS